MALFGKKKGEAPAPASSSTPAPADNSAFDFDAISRDLEAHNGASPFDALLSQPASGAPTNTPPTPAPAPMDSAFDLPEQDPLQVDAAPSTPVVPSSVPPQITTGTVVPTTVVPATPIAPTPESVINAPLSTTPVVVDVAAPVPVQVPVGRVRPELKPKKPFPLIPLLGTLGALAVLGGGAMFLLNSQKQPLDDNVPAPTRPRLAQRPPVAPAAIARPVAPPVQTAGNRPAPGLRSASPGIAPPVSTTRPALPSLSGGTSQIPVRTGQNPFSSRPATGIKGPSATAGLDGALASRLKALWRAGADAKHRGNVKEARSAWEEALRLRPGHPGFREALAQLPK